VRVAAPKIIPENISTNAHRLCRHQKSAQLWVSLASAALGKKQLDTAEIALAEINEVSKVSTTHPVHLP
jgi:hypothetical protein